MIIHAELYQGQAYLLLEDGKVWRVTSRFNDSPLMQCLGQLEHEQMRLMAEPRLAVLFPGVLT